MRADDGPGVAPIAATVKTVVGGVDGCGELRGAAQCGREAERKKLEAGDWRPVLSAIGALERANKGIDGVVGDGV